MLTIRIGNLFESKASTIVNTVNCVGIMGKGIALDFKNKFPSMHKEYEKMCKLNLVHPGEPYLFRDLTGISIINFPTKDHWKSPSKLSYIISGLKWFIENYKDLDIKSVAFPPLGCGNGGLNWELVGPIMYKMLEKLPIYIEIYAPYGTKQEQLTKEFLEKNCIKSTSDFLGSKSIQFNDRWLLIPYVVMELNSSKYSLAVGRTIFQKICYVLTRCGIATGFKFVKGSYGPYSSNVAGAITVLSNANMISEKKFGKMVAVEATSGFKLDKSKFSDTEFIAVNKTIDLFSRIKSTDQAEMISTVLFSADELLKKSVSASEKDVYNFVTEWKPQWLETKATDISESVRNLAILGWINVTPSIDLPHALELEI